MRTLITRGLVHEVGTDPDSGGGLYATTPLFLERLGLTSLAELPDLAPFLPETATMLGRAPRLLMGSLSRTAERCSGMTQAVSGRRSAASGATLGGPRGRRCLSLMTAIRPGRRGGRCVAMNAVPDDLNPDDDTPIPAGDGRSEDMELVPVHPATGAEAPTTSVRGSAAEGPRPRRRRLPAVART